MFSPRFMPQSVFYTNNNNNNNDNLYDHTNEYFSRISYQYIKHCYQRGPEKKGTKLVKIKTFTYVKKKYSFKR